MPFSPTTALLLCLLGAGVGVFGTLVGAGGGFILTPLLLLLYPRSSPDLITGISLVVVFFNAGSGTLAYRRQRRIDSRSGAAFALATIPGAVLGVIAARQVSRPTFDLIIGLVLCALAAWLTRARTEPVDPGSGPGSPRALTSRDGHTYRYRARVRRGVVLSLGVGFVSSFLGIGGGVVHVPLLVGVLGFPTHIATATSHFVLAFMALAATVVHVVTGTFHDALGLRRATALSVGVVAGAQVGALLSQRCSARTIRWLLAGALVLLGLRLVAGVLL